MTPVFSVDGVMGEETKAETKLTCRINGTGNTC